MVQEVFLEHRLEAFKSNVCQSLNGNFFCSEFWYVQSRINGLVVFCRLFLFLLINMNCVK